MHVRQELFDMFFMQRLPRGGFTLEGESTGEVPSFKAWSVAQFPESPVKGFPVPDPQVLPLSSGGITDAGGPPDDTVPGLR